MLLSRRESEKQFMLTDQKQNKTNSQDFKSFQKDEPQITDPRIKIKAETEQSNIEKATAILIVTKKPLNPLQYSSKFW